MHLRSTFLFLLMTGLANGQAAPVQDTARTSLQMDALRISFQKEMTLTLRQQVLTAASWALQQRPVTVTDAICPRSAGGPHDFYSEGDYWWPVPGAPDSPYIQRDGMTNPDNFTEHRKAMIRLSRIVGALASAYRLTGDEKYVTAALQHCRAWFVDTATRMDPSLPFAQAVKGRAKGRGIGIIDTIHFIEVVQGLLAMEEARSMDRPLLVNIRHWFGQYLDWLTTSSNGRDEMNATNNHGTCWTLQVAAFAKFTGNKGWMDFCRDRYKKILLPAQMAPDGSFPLELKRTKPYGYSIFNLDAMTTLCDLLSTKEEDLWHYQTPDGRSIRKGMEFLYPYITDKSKWPHAPDVMYWKEWPVAQPFLFFGAMVFGRKDWLDTWTKLDHAPLNEEVIRNLPVRHPLIWFMPVPPGHPAPNAVDERLAWWREARFGMFIHWGVYAVPAGTYQGRQIGRAAEWIMNRGKIPVAEYRQFARQFNPVKYDPEAWVRMAKAAGMKYIVITAKHHDGFALFRTDASKWNVVDATPYGKDLLKPLAAACRKYGIKLGFYYSQAQDWNNPGGAATRKATSEGWANPDSARIDAYTKEHNGHWDPAQTTAPMSDYIDKVAVPQVKELLTNYGKIAVLWWDTPTGMTDEYAQKLQAALALQPAIITNDRLQRPNFPGDYSTPEQRIPNLSELDGKDWETCMTMNGTWGYKSSDHNWKTPATLVHNLVDIASKGGNYLLNVGPTAEGEFPKESIDDLKAIGAWMKVNGEAIYSTSAGPFGTLPWGRCTRKTQKGNTILYLSVFDWPADGKLTVPGLKNEVVRATLLAGGAALPTNPGEAGLVINLPQKAVDPIATVIRLELKGEYLSPTVAAPLGGLSLKPHSSIDQQEFTRQYHLNKHYWDEAFDFLRSHDLPNLARGKYIVDTDNVFVSVTEDSTRDFDKTNWESHRKYIDIICVIKGEERIGVCPVEKSTLTRPYDEKKESANYSADGKYYDIPAGTFVIFFPADAHRPNITTGAHLPVKVVVVKVRVG